MHVKCVIVSKMVQDFHICTWGSSPSLKLNTKIYIKIDVCSYKKQTKSEKVYAKRKICQVSVGWDMIWPPNWSILGPNIQILIRLQRRILLKRNQQILRKEMSTHHSKKLLGRGIFFHHVFQPEGLNRHLQTVNSYYPRPPPAWPPTEKFRKDWPQFHVVPLDRGMVTLLT